MAAKKTQKNFFSKKFNQVNRVISKLEGEFEKALGQIKKQSDKSSKALKKNLDEIIDKLGAGDIYSKASEKTEGISKEVKRLADELVVKIKKIDLTRSSDVFSEVRENLDQLIQKLSQAELLEQAKVKAATTRNQVLHILNVPTKTDLDSLSKKVGNLEKKVKILSNRSAVAA